MKKGQGLSVQTIIIAIIVLVVLVVLVAIFTGFFGGFNQDVNSCQTLGGVCRGSSDICGTEGGTVNPVGNGQCRDDPLDEDVCCIFLQDN